MIKGCGKYKEGSRFEFQWRQRMKEKKILLVKNTLLEVN